MTWTLKFLHKVPGTKRSLIGAVTHGADSMWLEDVEMDLDVEAYDGALLDAPAGLYELAQDGYGVDLLIVRRNGVIKVLIDGELALSREDSDRER